MQRLSHQIVEDQTIKRSTKDADAYRALGPELELRRCTVVFDIAAKYR